LIYFLLLTFCSYILSFFFYSYLRMRGVRLENTPVFHNIQVLHTVKIVFNTSDLGDRLAGFVMVHHKCNEITNIFDTKNIKQMLSCCILILQFLLCLRMQICLCSQKLHVILLVRQHTMHNLLYFCKQMLVISYV
jgi:hypothetical protein